MIYWANATDTPLDRTPSLAKWTTADDLQQLGSRKSKTTLDRSLSARACLRAILTHVTKKEGWIFRPDTQGKILALTTDGKTGPHISLSHTKGKVACAVSLTSAVGVDIEYHHERSFAELAAYAFGPTEQRYVADQGIDAFYKIWTLREALAKTTGNGVFSMLDGKDALTTFSKEGCWTDQEWNLFSTKISPNHSLSIATSHNTDWGDKDLSSIDILSIG